MNTINTLEISERGEYVHRVVTIKDAEHMMRHAATQAIRFAPDIKQAKEWCFPVEKIEFAVKKLRSLRTQSHTLVLYTGE